MVIGGILIYTMNGIAFQNFYQDLATAIGIAASLFGGIVMLVYLITRVQR